MPIQRPPDDFGGAPRFPFSTSSRLRRLIAALGLAGERERGEMESRSQVEAQDTGRIVEAEEAAWRATLGEILAAAEAARSGRSEPDEVEIATDLGLVDEERTDSL